MSLSGIGFPMSKEYTCLLRPLSAHRETLMPILLL